MKNTWVVSLVLCLSVLFGAHAAAQNAPLSPRHLPLTRVVSVEWWGPAGQQINDDQLRLLSDYLVGQAIDTVRLEHILVEMNAEVVPLSTVPLQVALSRADRQHFLGSGELRLSLLWAPPSASRGPEGPTERWTLQRDTDLREQLDAWSTRAGWSLVWDSEYSYGMQAEATFEGDFSAAVTQLFTALGKLNPPLYPSLYPGNQVLLVQSKPAQ